MHQTRTRDRRCNHGRTTIVTDAIAAVLFVGFIVALIGAVCVFLILAAPR